MFISKLRKTLATDSGMHCVWDPSSFTNINDYDSWENELLDDKDIIKHIRKGSFVPININSDGAYEFEIRVGTPEAFQQLSEREKKYLTVSSEEYCYISNGTACVSGIEYVCNKPDEYVGYLDVANGEYSVIVHLIAWDEEPDGTPKTNALPDFIIIMNPYIIRKKYRVNINTFPDPS